MKLIIKFPNGDLVEIHGHEQAHQRLTEIQEEDDTVLLDCEIIGRSPKKIYSHPKRVIECLEEQSRKPAKVRKPFRCLIEQRFLSTK